MNTDLEFAQFADQHGSIRIGLDNHNDKGYYYEQYRVSGPEPVLKALQSRFGGSVSTNGRNCSRIWRLTADKAFDFFEIIRPHLVFRGDEVDVCLSFGRSRRFLAEEAQRDGASRRHEVAEVASQARTALAALQQAKMANQQARQVLAEMPGTRVPEALAS